MNLLGVDYSKKCIGLSWVQLGLDVVLPFGTVKGLEELINVIKKENINKAVFGLPFDTETMKENYNTKKIRKFADEFKKRVNIEIDFEDESYTTAEAKEMGGNASLDEKAAMLILQSYLDKNRSKI